MDAFLPDFQFVIMPFSSLLVSSRIPSFYSGLCQISSSLCFSRLMRCCNLTFFAISTLANPFSKPLILLSCLSRPISSLNISKALEDGKREFNMLQTLHLEMLNDLSNAGSKMAAETTSQFQKSLPKEINDLRNELGKEMPNDVHNLPCVLSSMLQKLINSKVFTTNRVTCGKGRKPSRSCESSISKTQQSLSNGCQNNPFDKYTHHLQSVLKDLIMK